MSLIMVTTKELIDELMSRYDDAIFESIQIPGTDKRVVTLKLTGADLLEDGVIGRIKGKGGGMSVEEGQ